MKARSSSPPAASSPTAGPFTDRKMEVSHVFSLIIFFFFFFLLFNVVTAEKNLRLNFRIRRKRYGRLIDSLIDRKLIERLLKTSSYQLLQLILVAKLWNFLVCMVVMMIMGWRIQLEHLLLPKPSRLWK